MRMLLFRLKWWGRNRRERAQMWAAYRLPSWLTYWAGVRMAAHATTGAYGSESPDEVSVMDMLKRWNV